MKQRQKFIPSNQQSYTKTAQLKQMQHQELMVLLNLTVSSTVWFRDVTRKLNNTFV